MKVGRDRGEATHCMGWKVTEEAVLTKSSMS